MNKFESENANRSTIHLFVTNKCDHQCKYCCNKEYDINDIPFVSANELRNARHIYITGGEPFLVEGISSFAFNIRNQYPNISKICIYTSGFELLEWMDKGHRLRGFDGVNFSPKNKRDVEAIKLLLTSYRYAQITTMSTNRLYVYPEVNVSELVENIIKPYYNNFEIIEREWQQDFKPNGGIFRRLPILF